MMCGDGKESIRPASHPVHVVEEQIPSPHPFLDKFLPRSNIKKNETAIYFKAARSDSDE